MKKRVFSLILAMTLVLGLCPVLPTAKAETVDTSVCPCCGKAFSSITWKEVGKGWFDAYTDFSKAGHYKITDAFTLRSEHSVSSKVVIDFNGFLLQTKNNGRGFTVRSGGMLTFINSGGSNGRLENKSSSMSKNGAAIQVMSGGTLNLYGGSIVGTVNSADGGTIYNDGDVNLYGGTVRGGSVTGTAGGGNIYNRGILNIYGGTVSGGVAANGNGGNIFNDGDVNLYNGTVTGGSVTGTGGGGNIFNSFIVTMHGGTVENGTVASGNGGNIHNGINGIYAGMLTMYDGTISGGKANGETSLGGNLMVESTGGFAIYGGTVSDGIAFRGGNIAVAETGSAPTPQQPFNIAGGTVIADMEDVHDILPGVAADVFKIYALNYTGRVDIRPYVADCGCCIPNAYGYDVWNVGYFEETCTDSACIYSSAVAAGSVTPVSLGHEYEQTGENTYTCIGCGKTRVVGTVVATVDGMGYSDLKDALLEASTGAVVKLEADVTVSELAVKNVTLDLNGYTLTADSFTAAVAGSVIDSSQKNTGKLNCADVTLAENNGDLPVTYEESIRFCPVGFEQWVEPVDVNTTKVKFYFTQRDKDTIIDDAVNGGNTELDVLIHLSWTDAAGQPQEKTVSFGTALVQKYAQKWNGRVFVATITGTRTITDLKCTYQVTSKAASGVTLSAETIQAASFINDKLSWEKINAYPIKTTDMTVEEMRQLCVDFMEFNKTYLWTPSESVDFIRNSAGTYDTMTQGTIYGGLPYVGVATGNPYRMMDYINENGIVDMQKALPLLGTKDRLEYADLKYFGSQCSIAVYWAWGRVMNSTNYTWTSSATPYNQFVILGDVVIPDTVKSWNATYGTDECVAENGEQVMFGGYAKLQKADGMVYYTTAGHLIMAYSDPVVVYNDDGTINGDESYIYIIDQAQKWEECTNDSGDTYLRKSSVNAKKTFTQLFNAHYIPFTFEEFLGTDPVEITEVALVKSSTAYVKGTVSEENRSFQATKTTNSLTWSQLFDCSITSNYGIVDAYIIVKDAAGNELYKHAVRTATAGNMNLAMEESGEMVTTWVTGELRSGRTYKAEIVVQLSTGERPTIWNGQLTIDN